MILYFLYCLFPVGARSVSKYTHEQAPLLCYTRNFSCRLAAPVTGARYFRCPGKSEWYFSPSWVSGHVPFQDQSFYNSHIFRPCLPARNMQACTPHTTSFRKNCYFFFFFGLFAVFFINRLNWTPGKKWRNNHLLLCCLSVHTYTRHQ